MFSSYEHDINVIIQIMDRGSPNEKDSIFSTWIDIITYTKQKQNNTMLLIFHSTFISSYVITGMPSLLWERSYPVNNGNNIFKWALKICFKVN